MQPLARSCQGPLFLVAKTYASKGLPRLIIKINRGCPRIAQINNATSLTEKGNDMKKFIFILGGVRSGKSHYAVELAKGPSRKVAYIATCIHPDAEMKERIKLHQSFRPKHWKVIEEGQDIGSVLNKLKNKYELVIIDCLGLVVSNLLADQRNDNEILKSLKLLVKRISHQKASIILVSNEVGSGIVPQNSLARRFRDLVGLANQMMAKAADEVILMQSGIPLKLK